jgi:hypothetical protein
VRCRPGCGACCIAPSISSPIPGMPGGKPAGIPCVHLTDDRRCRLFGQPGRPAVCVAFRPCPETCGATPEEALAYLGWLEAHTAPARPIRRQGHPPIACSGDVLDASVPAG